MLNYVWIQKGAIFTDNSFLNIMKKFEKKKFT